MSSATTRVLCAIVVSLLVGLLVGERVQVRDLHRLDGRIEVAGRGFGAHGNAPFLCDPVVTMSHRRERRHVQEQERHIDVQPRGDALDVADVLPAIIVDHDGSTIESDHGLLAERARRAGDHHVDHHETIADRRSVILDSEAARSQHGRDHGLPVQDLLPLGHVVVAERAQHVLPSHGPPQHVAAVGEYHLDQAAVQRNQQRGVAGERDGRRVESFQHGTSKCAAI